MKGTDTKRSNKDLGRVLAIASVSKESNMERWPERWRRGLTARFPKKAGDLAARAGDGIRALIGSEGDLYQAAESCNAGLLARKPTTPERLREIGSRVLMLTEELKGLR